MVYGPYPFHEIVELYAFADRRQAPAVADLTVSIMLEKMSVHGVLPSEAFQHLLDGTMAGRKSHVFNMLVEVATLFVAHDGFDEIKAKLPKEFYVAMLDRQRSPCEPAASSPDVHLGTQNKRKRVDEDQPQVRSAP